MADPRGSIDYEGVHAKYMAFAIDDSTITYDSAQAGGSAQVGLAVAMSAAGTIELAGDGEEIVGKLKLVESDNFATVQVGGCTTLPGGTSATLTVGKKFVGDLLVSAEGYIREVAEGTAAELAVARGMIIDASDTDNVVVYLDA